MEASPTYKGFGINQPNILGMVESFWHVRDKQLAKLFWQAQPILA
jgi:hypothetical protein